MSDINKYAEHLRIEQLEDDLTAANARADKAELALAAEREVSATYARVGDAMKARGEARIKELEGLTDLLLHEHDARVIALREPNETNLRRSLNAHQDVDAAVRSYRAKQDAAAREAVKS
jgi:hypothetical protein